MADALKFEDSVQLAIKTIRQIPHSRINMTEENTIQLYFSTANRATSSHHQ